MTISDAMLDLIIDVGSSEYRRSPWRLHAASVRACLARKLIAHTTGPRRRCPYMLTVTGWAVHTVAKMLRAEQEECRRISVELHQLKRARS